MALAAGALSNVSFTGVSVNNTSAVATGGTAPYTYQWYMSLVSGFTPGAGNIISGATALSLYVTGLLPGATYYFVVKVTDSASATANSSQLAVTLSQGDVLSQNQFALQPYLGMTDLRFNGDTLEVQFDPAGSGTLVAGSAVKWSTASGGVPKVVPSLSQSDVVVGFVNYDIKSTVYNPGDKLEVSMFGNVMYLACPAAVARGQFVCNLPAAVAGGATGGVVAVTGSSGYPIVGYALDQIAAGGFGRIFLQTPPPPYAID